MLPAGTSNSVKQGSILKTTKEISDKGRRDCIGGQTTGRENVRILDISHMTAGKRSERT